MTYRKIDTRMWRDPWFESLSAEAKFLFVFFITSNDCNLSGIFEISKKAIAFSTSLPINKIDSAIAELNPKVIYMDGWIGIRNFQKYQVDNDKARTSAKAYESLAPKPILDTLSIPYQYPIDTVSTITEHKQIQSTNTEYPPICSPLKKGEDIPFAEIISHLNWVSGKRFRDSQAYRRLIAGRWKEGFRLEDFKRVHINMFNLWKDQANSDGTPMLNWFCPTTLYRPSNFEKYLQATNQAQASKKEIMLISPDMNEEFNIIRKTPNCDDPQAYTIYYLKYDSYVDVRLTRAQFLEAQERRKKRESNVHKDAR